MRCIVGLGNPGKEYEYTRHNAGFLLLDALAKKQGLNFTFDKKSNADVATWHDNGKKILLVKPQTFMNNSGESVRKIFDYYKLLPGDIVIVHDDKDFPLGTYTFQKNRGAAGHNGVISIINHLGTKDFLRLRLGVGPEKPGIEKIVDYVLETFSAQDQRTFQAIVPTILNHLIRDYLSPTEHRDNRRADNANA